MFQSSLNHPDTFNANPRPPPYVISNDGAPAQLEEGDGLIIPDEPPPAYPISSPHVHVSTTASAAIFTAGNSRPAVRNPMVRNVSPDAQIPDVYPGCAFCKFPPGIIETVIRSSVVVRYYKNGKRFIIDEKVIKFYLLP